METMQESGKPRDLVERPLRSTDAHDLQGIGACVPLDHRLEISTHPGGDVVGREQVLRNWREIFAGARTSRETVEVGTAAMAFRPAATPPISGATWTER